MVIHETRTELLTYRDHFGWEKVFQMIPIADVLFGAYTNKSISRDTADVAIMLYRKRRVLERLAAFNEQL